MVISVMIVEDEPEFLRRLCDAVLADAGLSLLGAVSSGIAAKALLNAQAPDVLLVDLGLPDINGVEVIAHAARVCPQCDVVVVTLFADAGHVLASIEAGATGYLLKDASSQHIAASIHEVRAGGSPISPRIARHVLARLRIAPGNSSPAPLMAAESCLLSQREIEILRLVAKGFSFETVSEVLGISVHTVVTHVKKVYRKLAVHSRGEAVYEAGQLGLL